MGDARKQLFFDLELYPNVSCIIHNSLETNT